MKYIKKFESSENDETRLQPKVKHLIQFLSTLDPEADLSLDRDGWYTQGDASDEVDLISKRGLFDSWDFDGKTIVTINN